MVISFFVGAHIDFVLGDANIQKEELTRAGRGRWTGNTVKFPYWRIHFIHASGGTFFPTCSLKNGFMMFDKKHKAVNASKDESLWADQESYLYDICGRWWIVYQCTVVAELGMPSREGRGLDMWERSPSITYPGDSFWLIDNQGNKHEFGTAEDALSFAVNNKDMFKADNA